MLTYACSSSFRRHQNRHGVGTARGEYQASRLVFGGQMEITSQFNASLCFPFLLSTRQAVNEEFSKATDVSISGQRTFISVFLPFFGLSDARGESTTFTSQSFQDDTTGDCNVFFGIFFKNPNTHIIVLGIFYYLLPYQSPRAQFASAEICQRSMVYTLVVETQKSRVFILRRQLSVPFWRLRAGQ